MAKDPYKLLGVKRDATDKEIQKAYRALAKKLHPDVNPDDKEAQERFKEVSAAYTLLSDKNLRAQYDSGQVDGSGQQQNPFAGGFGGGSGGFGGFNRNTKAQMEGMGMGFEDMNDLFSSLFGMQMGAGGQQSGHPFSRTRTQTRPRPQKGADVRYSLEISLPDAVRGESKQVRMGDGKGLKLNIPAGIEDGTTLRLRGKGEPGVNGGPPGDALVNIGVKPHKFLRRDGDKLRMDLPISLKEAVLGAMIKAPTPHGRVNLKIAPGSSSGKTLRLKGKGVKGGDMLVRLMIILPEKIPKDLKDSVGALPDGPDVRAGIKF